MLGGGEVYCGSRRVIFWRVEREQSHDDSSHEVTTVYVTKIFVTNFFVITKKVRVFVARFGIVRDMYYIVGLGNPGAQYEDTRHNCGFALVRELAATASLPPLRTSARYQSLLTEGIWQETTVTVVLPTTFMNKSGEAVAALVPKDKVEKMIVVYDDAALPLGKVRISLGGSAGGHNGVRSIIESLGNDAFIRVRLGVGAPAAGISLERHVLGRFAPEEKKEVEALITQGVEAARLIVEKGVAVAMNKMNGGE